MDKKELLSVLRQQRVSEEIINAFNKIDRAEFVLPEHHIYAYENIALSIGEDQTISQPSTIALMLSLLEVEQDSKVLEVGSGSGYVLALLSKIAKKGNVFGVEINRVLAERSKLALEECKNVKVFRADGCAGLPTYSPFNRILVSASAPSKKFLQPLIDQLTDPGIIVAPVGTKLLRIRKFCSKLEEKSFDNFAFVPLIVPE